MIDATKMHSSPIGKVLRSVRENQRSTKWWGRGRWCTCLELDKLCDRWRRSNDPRPRRPRGRRTRTATPRAPLYRSHTSLARGSWENQFSFPCFTGSLRKHGFPTPIWQHDQWASWKKRCHPSLCRLSLTQRNIIKLHTEWVMVVYGFSCTKPPSPITL